MAPWLLQEGTAAATEVCVAFIEGVERCSRIESVWKRKQVCCCLPLFIAPCCCLSPLSASHSVSPD